MSRLRRWVRTIGPWASLVVTIVAWVLNVLDLFPRVAWQWIAIGSLGAFALLGYWRVSEVERELAKLKSNQQLELAIRRMQERGRSLMFQSGTIPRSDLLTAIDRIKAWTVQSEDELEAPAYLRHFRGTDGTGVFDEFEGLLAERYGGDIPAAQSFGANPLNEYLDIRINRLGEILFSLPGPSSKAMMLG